MIRVAVVVLLLGIVFSLFAGLRSLYRDRAGDDGTRTVRLLTWRILLSIALFLLLLGAFRAGWIPGYSQ